MKKNNTSIKIHFLGATETVTGSKYLIETNSKKIVIDCGLFQGLKELRLRNWNNLPLDVSSIDCVLLTHGHLDHVGYLPLLVKQGFSGSIFATEPTIEITKLILKDSAKIQEEDAERANRYQYSKHHPAKPLYDTKEAETVFPLFSAVKPSIWHRLDDNVAFRFRYNGHIIGSCFIEIKVNQKIIVFSGDLGREEDPLLRAPEKPDFADVILTESTYGNRFHPKYVKQILADAVNKAAEHNGTIIIPSFAVERTQLLMYLLWELKKENNIPEVPIYMDSPMGKHVLDVFVNNLSWHKLSLEDCHAMCKDIKIISKPIETENLARDKHSKIIIASSGMATGGRVLTYFEHYLNNPLATILLAGYQGEGTRGRMLLDGAKEIKMRGKMWPVRASVTMVDGLSAHADESELIDWLSDLKVSPKHIFITHGEKESSEMLASKILEVYGWKAEIPKFNQVITV